MTNDNDDDVMRIKSREHPETYVKGAISRLNDGHDEVVLSAVGGAQQNLQNVLGRLLIEAHRDNGVYNLPAISVDDVDPFVQEFDDDDGPSEAEGVRVTVAT